jgi:hypothetical protein
VAVVRAASQRSELFYICSSFLPQTSSVDGLLFDRLLGSAYVVALAEVTWPLSEPGFLQGCSCLQAQGNKIGNGRIGGFPEHAL